MGIYLSLGVCISLRDAHIYMCTDSSSCVLGCYVSNMLLRNGKCYYVTFYVDSMGRWFGAVVETAHFVQVSENSR